MWHLQVFCWQFILTKSSPVYLPIYYFSEQVNTKTVLLNIYYLVGDYIEKRTENFWEIFYEDTNNPFGLYIFYFEIYLRVYFNLFKPVSKIIIENYLPMFLRWKKDLTMWCFLCTAKLEKNWPDIWTLTFHM